MTSRVLLHLKSNAFLQSDYRQSLLMWENSRRALSRPTHTHTLIPERFALRPPLTLPPCAALASSRALFCASFPFSASHPVLSIARTALSFQSLSPLTLPPCAALASPLLRGHVPASGAVHRTLHAASLSLRSMLKDESMSSVSNMISVVSFP
jgi:hypothetical protein